MKNNTTLKINHILSILIIASMVLNSFAIPVSAAASAAASAASQAGWSPTDETSENTNVNPYQVAYTSAITRQNTVRETPTLPQHHPNLSRADACYWADLDCDQDVDAADLSWAAQFWNCALGDDCYDPSLDHNGDHIIDALDLAAVGNEYDIAPPVITITTPQADGMVNQAVIQVTGTAVDKHPIQSVSINGVNAVLTGNNFTAQVTLPPGTQPLEVVAVDAVGARGTKNILVHVDVEGPVVSILAPKHRQTAYSFTPPIQVQYVDYFGAANPASLQASLEAADGTIMNITGDLAAGAEEAVGVVSTPLVGDSTYTLTVSIADTAGNIGTASASFYVPAAGNIVPPEVPENAGWVSGVIYDSTTCEGGQEQPVYCTGVSGAHVTLSLSADPENPLTGTIVTGPDGFFAFPVGTTEQYWLRVEREGFTYGQRDAEIVRDRATPVNEIYLTPIDSNAILCTGAGCEMESSDGLIRVDIPPGAILGRDVVQTTATNFEQVEYLPSGSLPEGTWETYALNLGGDSEYEFAKPITVSMKNTLEFVPGTIIPLGYWNQNTQEWEHAGQGVVQPDGEWVVFTTTHFSNYDINAPVTISTSEIEIEDFTASDTSCPVWEETCSAVNIRSGAFQEDFSLPPVTILGVPYAPTFRYNSQRAYPGEVIEINIALTPAPGMLLGSYVQAELYIEGQKTDNFTFATNPLGQGGDIGRFRYFWDGKDAQGSPLPAGVYTYDIRIRIPYQAMYYYSVNNRFGGPPDYTRPFGRYVNATAEKWVHGTVSLDADPDNPFGVGWSLDDWVQLHEDEAGHILVQSGRGMDEYYFPGKDLLLEAAGRHEARAAANRGGLEQVKDTPFVEDTSSTIAPVQVETPPAPEPAASQVQPVSRNPISIAPLEYPTIQVSSQAVENAAVDEEEEPIQVSQQTNPPHTTILMDELTNWQPEFAPYTPLSPVGMPTSPPKEIATSPAPASLYVFPENITPQTNKSGNITTDETWTLADSPYLLTGNVTVLTGVTLTIEPGVIVQGASGTRLQINGHLDAVGTLAQPILFTSQTNSGPDQWQGVVFSGGTGHLKYSNIRYAGQYNGTANSGLTAVNVTSGKVLVENSTINNIAREHSVDYGVFVSSSHFEMVNTTLEFNGDTTLDYAMYVFGTNTVLTLTNNTIQNNQRDTVRLGTLWQDAVLNPQAKMHGYEVVSNFVVPAGYTLTLEPGTVMMGDGQRILVQGHLQAIGTPTSPITFTSYTNTGSDQWQGLYFDGGTGHLKHTNIRYAGSYDGFTHSGLTVVNVTNGKVLVENSTINHNARVFSDDNGIVVSNSHFEMVDSLLEYNGNNTSDFAMYATGVNTVLTLTNNIIENNQRDTVRLGTLWPDAVLRPQAKMHGYEVASWFAIPAGFTLTLEPGTVMMGDGQRILVQGHLQAIGTPALPITFTSYANTGGDQWQGLYFDGGTGHLKHTNIRYAGTYNGFAYSGLTAVNVTDGKVLVENTIIHHNARAFSDDYGVFVNNSHFEMVNSLLEYNGNSAIDYAMYATGVNTVLTLTNNIIENNQRDTVRLGTLWPDAVLRPQAKMHGYEVASWFAIPAGFTLTLEPGTVIMGDGQRILVQGHLQAIGTPTLPITFTSYTNTGGDQWQGLHFVGGTGHLKHTNIRYAGSYNGFAYSSLTAVDVTDGKVLIENSIINNNAYAFSTDYGVFVSNSHFEMVDSLLEFNGNDTSDFAMYATGVNTVLTLTNNIIENNQRDTVRLGTLWPDAILRPQAKMRGYEVVSNFVVPAGYILTLEPGTVMMGDSYRIWVKGHLQAIGTPALPITFTSYANTAPDQWQGLVFEGGTGHLKYTNIRYGGHWNSFSYNGLAAINVTNGKVLVENSIIHDNFRTFSTDSAIFINNSHFEMKDTILENNGNTLTDYGMYVMGANTVITLTNNTLQDNWRDTILLAEYMAGVSRLVPQARMFGYELGNEFTIPEGMTMTVEGGTQIVADGGVELHVLGHLETLGTATAPITFTSFANNGVSQWEGILFLGGSGNLQHTTVQRASAWDSYAYSNITIRNTKDRVVRLENSKVLFGAYNFGIDYGGIFIENSTAIISNTLFSGNGNSPTDYVLYATGANTITVQNTTFQNNAGIPIRMPANTLASLIGNHFFANGASRIELTGNITLDKDLSFNPQGGLEGYLFTGSITVPEGRTLTIQPGLTLFFGSNQGLIISGTLKAHGTESQKVLFTSSTNTSRGQWKGIEVKGGTADLMHATIRFANTGLRSHDGNLVLKVVDVRTNRDHGIHITGAGTQFLMRTCGIYDNRNFSSSYGILNETGSLVDARFNWWGSTSGPSYTGLNTGGDRVSDLVLFDPWLEEPLQDLGINPRTGTDTSILTYSPATGSYQRAYPDGRQYQFNPDGTLDYSEDSGGNQMAFTYNPDGTIKTMGFVLPGEINPRWVWTFAYQNGRLATITDPAGQVITFEINPHGDLLSVDMGDGTTYRFGYDGNHLLTQSVQPGGQVATYQYDAYGRIQESTLPGRVAYDPTTGAIIDTPDKIFFAPGDTSHQLVNQLPSGDIQNPTMPLVSGGTILDAVTFRDGGYTAQTNAYGSTTSTTDALGRETFYIRDAADRVLRETSPSGRCTEYTYDAAGNMLTESRMGPAQCSLTPSERDPAQVLTWRYTYEPRFSQVKTQTDPAGSTTTFVFDYETGAGNAGLVVQIIYPAVPGNRDIQANPAITHTYNQWGLIETTTSPNGTVTRYFYTQGIPAESTNGTFAPGVTPVPGLLTRVVQDYGDMTHLNIETSYTAFNGRGNPGTVTGPGCCNGGSFAHYTYDAYGRILTETDANGIVTRFTYDANGTLIEKIQDYTADGLTGKNLRTVYTYDNQGNLLTERTQADGIDVQYSYGYDVNGNRVMVKNPLGYTTWYVYDAAGQLTQIIAPDGGTTNYTYDPDGRLETITDPEGSVTRHLYDSLWRRSTTIYDEGGEHLTYQFAYDANDRLIEETNPTGTKTCITYDNLGQVIQEMEDCGGLNLSNAYTYDLDGNLAKAVDERGIETAFDTDALGRGTAIHLDPAGLNLSLAFTYDTFGNPLTFTDERGTVTAYTYDALHRLTTMCEDTAGLNRCTTFTYDRLGYQDKITDPKGVEERYTRNAFGLVTRIVQDPGGLNAVTTLRYDNALQNTRVTDPNGNITRFNYNSMGEHASVVYADGTSIAYTYNLNGDIASLTNMDQSRAEYSYDGLGQLVRKDFYAAGGGAIGWQTFAYTPEGWLAEASEAMNGHTSTLAFTYNDLGDMTASTQTVNGNSWTTQYSYNYPLGETTTIYPSGISVKNTLDALGRYLQVQQNSSPVATYAYNDSAGSMTVSHANSVVETIQSNRLGDITQIHLKRAAVTLADYQYGYDASGHRVYTRFAHLAGTVADVYQYDRLYQPVEVWYGANSTSPAAISAYETHHQYRLDALGNRLDVTVNGTKTEYGPKDSLKLTDPMNRYTQVGGNPILYDGRGNITNDGAFAYTYDLLNRQITADGAQYVYDALGRRVAKILGGVATYYIYDQYYQVIEERGHDLTLAARYIYGDGIDALLKMERGGTNYHIHRDVQNSVTEVTNAAGNLVERYRYDIYGDPIFLDSTGVEIPASVIGNPYLYTGRRYDPETGNYYFRARMYSPGLGRFMQIDPIGFNDGWNLYNNYFVINHTDPYGLDVFGTQVCPVDGGGPCDAGELEEKLVQMTNKHQRQRATRGFKGFIHRVGNLPIIKQVRIGVRDTVRGALRELRTIAREARDLFRQIVRDTVKALRAEFRRTIQNLREDLLFGILRTLIEGGSVKGFCIQLGRQIGANFVGIGRQARDQAISGLANIIDRNSSNLQLFTAQGRRDRIRHIKDTFRGVRRQIRDEFIMNAGDAILPGLGGAAYEYRHRHDQPQPAAP